LAACVRHTPLDHRWGLRADASVVDPLGVWHTPLEFSWDQRMNDCENDGLVVAFLLDGEGGGEPLDWDSLPEKVSGSATLWVHLNRDCEGAERWLRQDSGLAPLVVESLLADSTRPHCTRIDDGALLFLRGVNLNPGAEPDDMVSIRLWVEPGLIVSVRKRRLLSVDDLRQSIVEKRGPRTPGEFLVGLNARLGQRIGDLVGEIDDEVDALEELVLESGSGRLRSKLTEFRRQIIAIRRYTAPQRDALARLTQLQLSWLSDIEALHLREEADRVIRLVEDLDAARDRATVTQEELSNLISEQMNKRMYVLSLAAAIFLPLGFLTGLFGINVGGIPLANDPWGFVDILLLAGAITGIQMLVFRWKGWF
jgi:zinc transporter